MICERVLYEDNEKEGIEFLLKSYSDAGYRVNDGEVTLPDGSLMDYEEIQKHLTDIKSSRFCLNNKRQKYAQFAEVVFGLTKRLNNLEKTTNT